MADEKEPARAGVRARITKVQAAIIIAVVAVAVVGGVYIASLPPATPPEPLKVFVNLQQYDFVTDLDPAHSFSGEIIVTANVYETLLFYTGGDPEVEPALATGYNASTDGLTWTFQLRRGVTFHDGTAFNANAVKYSIDRIRELGVGAVFIWDPVVEISVIDDYTVRFVLSYPAPLQRIVASSYGAWIYSPKTADIENLYDWFNQGNDAGSGPYRIKSLERGVKVILEQYENYWRGWEDHFEDRIDEVVFQIAEDATVRTLMMETGEAHYAAGLPTEERKRLETMPEVRTLWVETFFSHYAFLNTKNPYLLNKLVRQALAYSFPYDDFIKWGEGTFTQPVGPIPHGMWGHFDDLFQYSRNLTKAADLLSQAGYPQGGFSLKYLYISGVGSMGTAGELWKESLSQLGIDLQLVGLTWPSIWELIKQGPQGPNPYDIVAFAWWPTYITPYDFLYNMFHTEEVPFWNAAYYGNPEFDRLIDDAWKLEGPDPDAALQLYRQAQEILIDDSPAVFLDDLRNPLVLRSNVLGIVVNPAYGYDTFFFWYMWLAEE